MAQTGLTDVAALVDPLQGYGFDLIIPNLPFGGDSRGLTVKCMNTPLPSKSTEELAVTLHGVEFRYAGRQTWSHTLATEFLETRDLSTWTTLDAWVRGARDAVANTGTYQSRYKTQGIIRLYDDTRKTIFSMTLNGLFCRSIEDPAFAGNTSEAVTIRCEFNFDYTT